MVKRYAIEKNNNVMRYAMVYDIVYKMDMTMMTVTIVMMLRKNLSTRSHIRLISLAYFRGAANYLT